MRKNNIIDADWRPAEGKKQNRQRKRPLFHFDPETKMILALIGTVVLIAADVMAFIRALEMAAW